MNNSLPMADAIPTSIDIVKLNKKLLTSNFIGLANNVKWNKLINYMRDKTDGKLSYRYKWITGYISNWDVECYYHLPFPFKGVIWLDIGVNDSNNINCTKELIALVNLVGFEYKVMDEFIRIFAYAPKDYELII